MRAIDLVSPSTKVCSVRAVVALQNRNGAIVGQEAPDGDPTFLETAPEC